MLSDSDPTVPADPHPISRTRFGRPSSRTIRALGDVYQNEGLPARSTLQLGELRHFTYTHTLEFADAISTPTLIPRNTGKPRGQSRKNTGRLPAESLPEK